MEKRFKISFGNKCIWVSQEALDKIMEIGIENAVFVCQDENLEWFVYGLPNTEEIL